VFGRTFADSTHIVEGVKVSNTASNEVVYSDSLGQYKIQYIIGKRNSLKFEKTNFNTYITVIPEIFDDEDFQLDPVLTSNVNKFTISPRVTATVPRFGTVIKPLTTRPSVTGDFIDMIKTMQGVSSGNELSSQYNVRGGSFDENLIYVNDFEVYRPQLIRSGQQEGLSFINGNMVDNLVFSPGGFEAKYGDKLSSVLNVNYRAPVKASGGFEIGLLGASIYVEDIIKAKKRVGQRDSTRFSFLIGGRYRGNKNILNSLDAIGLYKSRFGDLQSLMTLHINRYNRVELLVNYAQNRFRFEPEYQETNFGTLQSALKLKIGMDGQEIVDYNSVMGGLSYVRAKKDTEYKFMASAFSSVESEHYDIQGAYQISEVDNNLGSSGFGGEKSLLGLGYFINHGRNDLKFTVVNLAHIGTVKLRGFENKSKKRDISNLTHPTKLLYGLKYQMEVIQDVFKEWKYSDSGDFNMGQGSINDTGIFLSESIRSKSNINNQRYSGYVQLHQAFGGVNEFAIVAGMRYLYSTLNEQGLLSPRIQVYYEPNKSYNIKHKKDTIPLKQNVLLKGAFGYYYQAPFYREMRDFNGNVNTALKAQRSIHYTSGIEFGFKKNGRPFKMSAEVFYKDMDYLVPFILDNVRIRYYATNSARGYATGFDARINGQFIKDLESWFTLSVLKTDENIKYIDANGNEQESGLIRRPTDRRLSSSIVFQDELKTNKDYRMHLMLNFGSGLPYYLGGTARYKEGNTIPAYKRVDIGFSKVLIGGSKTKLKSKSIENMWIGVDVYNLLQINNVVSYMWVKDFSNNTYGVPNYLTGRRLNLRLVVKLK